MNETLNFYENYGVVRRYGVNQIRKKQPIEPALAGSLVAKKVLIFSIKPSYGFSSYFDNSLSNMKTSFIFDYWYLVIFHPVDLNVRALIYEL